MQYPLISEYVKAIQDAGDNLEQLAHLTPVLDDHGEPYRSSGAFAVVFKMQDNRTGKYYALKCFTEEQQGRAEAYRQIADELDLLDSPYITSVKYMEKELFVASQCEEDEFPVLLMDWVDGETMEAYIAANYRNQSAMSMLSYRFGKMAAWLRTQSFSHGDIKPDNIIVRPDGSLTLVDYDGMFVPSMKGSQSPTIGTRDFSHPLRTVDDFDETIDDFSLASIALSLKAISMKSTLLDIYGASDRLLFSENDYRNPSNSKVISALQELMCDKDFCTLYSLFMLALARKELSACSFRLFIGEKPILLQTIENLSTKAAEEELKEAITDEFGVKYSKDGRKLLKAPQKLDGTYSIRKGTKIICDEAFRWRKIIGCRSLKSLVIPDSVTNIGDYAFSGCRSLSSVVIPDSVTSIGDYAFWNCRSLTDIVIPDSVTSIGESAFKNCISLKSFEIPSSVSSIGFGAFDGCESLTNIVIPDSVVNLKGNPFCRWDGELKCLSPYFIYYNKVLFDKDKSKIIAFRDKDTTSYVIPDYVTSIGNGAFGGCESLTSIVVPECVTSIGDYAFVGCESLTDIVLSDRITSIGGSAFSGCKSLKSLVIPDSVTSIGDKAFWDCRSLTDIVIPDRVTSIGDGAFFACNSLTSIVIPSSVICIGTWAFYGCESLTNIAIPSSVNSIGDKAFDGCSSLTSIVIPDSVTSIGDMAFCGCSSLKYISIPKSVICLNVNPFFKWDGKLECLSPNFIYEDDVLFNKDKSKIIAFRDKNTTSYVIPDSVSCVGSSAFYDCKSLKNLVIPDSVTSIGESAFEGCSSLRSLVIPDSVTSIGKGAFKWCKFLTNIAIPYSVTSIGDGAFNECSALRSVVIPNSVTSIGDGAFDHCSALRSIVIPDSVTNIGDRAFTACYSLSNIVIPNGVTSIGDEAFAYCKSLRSIVIPDGVTRIGDRAFKVCYSLSNIVIPNGVTSIGDGAFAECKSLRSIIIPDGVTRIGDEAFQFCNFPNDLKQELISRFGEKIFG